MNSNYLDQLRPKSNITINPAKMGTIEEKYTVPYLSNEKSNKMQSDIRFVSLSARPEYQNYSDDELRDIDYKNKRNGMWSTGNSKIIGVANDSFFQGHFNPNHIPLSNNQTNAFNANNSNGYTNNGASFNNNLFNNNNNNNQPNTVNLFTINNNSNNPFNINNIQQNTPFNSNNTQHNTLFNSNSNINPNQPFNLANNTFIINASNPTLGSSNPQNATIAKVVNIPINNPSFSSPFNYSQQQQAPQSNSTPSPFYYHQSNNELYTNDFIMRHCSPFINDDNEAYHKAYWAEFDKTMAIVQTSIDKQKITYIEKQMRDDYNEGIQVSHYSLRQQTRMNPCDKLISIQKPLQLQQQLHLKDKPMINNNNKASYDNLLYNNQGSGYNYYKSNEYLKEIETLGNEIYNKTNKRSYPHSQIEVDDKQYYNSIQYKLKHETNKPITNESPSIKDLLETQYNKSTPIKTNPPCNPITPYKEQDNNPPITITFIIHTSLYTKNHQMTFSLTNPTQPTIDQIKSILLNQISPIKASIHEMILYNTTGIIDTFQGIITQLSPIEVSITELLSKPPPSPSCPIITKYNTLPTINALKEMTHEQLAHINGFTVYNEYASIQFKEEVDLNGVDIDGIITIEPYSLSCYVASCRDIPSKGVELNKPSRIMIYNIGKEEGKTFEEYAEELKEYVSLKHWVFVELTKDYTLIFDTNEFTYEL